MYPDIMDTLLCIQTLWTPTYVSRLYGHPYCGQLSFIVHYVVSIAASGGDSACVDITENVTAVPYLFENVTVH